MRIFSATKNSLRGIVDGIKTEAAVREEAIAFALAVPHDEALRIRDGVGFFQAVRAALVKHIPDDRKPPSVLDHAVRQIVSTRPAPTIRATSSWPRCGARTRTVRKPMPCCSASPTSR